MRMTKDEAEQALRIDVTFSPTVDKWVYPYFDLRRFETINGATSLDFEICVIESKEEYKGCREGNVFVNGFIKYPPPKMYNIWYKVSIDLTQKDLSKIATFQLGLNPKNLQIAFLMKNIHFNGTPQAPQLDPAIVTDTHCIRLCNLIGLVDNEKDPYKVEKKLWEIIPAEEGTSLCHRFVTHGRAVCVARRPKCDECCLKDICKFGKKQ